MRIEVAVFLVAFVSDCAVACDIPLMEYRVVTESEWGASLTLMPKGEYQARLVSWLAGRPDTMEVSSFFGRWECHGAAAIFTDNAGNTIHARYYVPRIYPLGIYKDTEAIVFEDVSDRSAPFSGLVFWPWWRGSE
jgi:hypothetical protein